MFNQQENDLHYNHVNQFFFASFECSSLLIVEKLANVVFDFKKS